MALELEITFLRTAKCEFCSSILGEVQTISVPVFSLFLLRLSVIVWANLSVMAATIAAALAVLPLASSLELPGEVGKLPALGWNSWVSSLV